MTLLAPNPDFDYMAVFKFDVGGSKAMPYPENKSIKFLDNLHSNVDYYYYY